MTYANSSFRRAFDGTIAKKIIVSALLGATFLGGMTACASKNPTVVGSARTIGGPGGNLTGTDTLYELANAVSARGDYNAAIPLYRKAHDKNTGLAGPLIGLGRALAAVGQYRDASDAFYQATQNNRKSAQAFYGLGNAQLALGQFNAAVVSLAAAYDLAPENARIAATFAVAHDATGEHQQAIAIYERAIRQNPLDLDLRSNFGLSQALHGDTDAAIERLEALVRDPSSRTQHRQNLALAYALAGRTRDAGAMAALDMAADAVRDAVTFYNTLRTLNPMARMTALLAGTVNPKTDLEQFANERVVNGGANPAAYLGVARLLAVETAGVQNDIDVVGVPPLIDPKGWAVQVAAYRKLSHLAPGWAYLSTKYSDLIGGLEPRRSEVNHPATGPAPNGFFYRLNAGPLTNGREARAICQTIADRGGDCWVRPPTKGEGRLPEQDQIDTNMLASRDHRTVVAAVDPKSLPPEPAPAEPTTPEAAPVATPTPASAEDPNVATVSEPADEPKTVVSPAVPEGQSPPLSEVAPAKNAASGDTVEGVDSDLGDKGERSKPDTSGVPISKNEVDDANIAAASLFEDVDPPSADEIPQADTVPGAETVSNDEGDPLTAGVDGGQTETAPRDLTTSGLIKVGNEADGVIDSDKLVRASATKQPDVGPLPKNTAGSVDERLAPLEPGETEKKPDPLSDDQAAALMPQAGDGFVQNDDVVQKDDVGQSDDAGQNIGQTADASVPSEISKPAPVQKPEPIQKPEPAQNPESVRDVPEEERKASKTDAEAKPEKATKSVTLSAFEAAEAAQVGGAGEAQETAPKTLMKTMTGPNSKSEKKPAPVMFVPGDIPGAKVTRSRKPLPASW
ncbi:MAG: tetratricopeptide repeat protein, partial [Pseudomonadota bacterium]